jgi:hypothetical protein
VGGEDVWSRGWGEGLGRRRRRYGIAGWRT